MLGFKHVSCESRWKERIGGVYIWKGTTMLHKISVDYGV